MPDSDPIFTDLGRQVRGSTPTPRHVGVGKVHSAKGGEEELMVGWTGGKKPDGCPFGPEVLGSMNLGSYC